MVPVSCVWVGFLKTAEWLILFSWSTMSFYWCIWTTDTVVADSIELTSIPFVVIFYSFPLLFLPASVFYSFSVCMVSAEHLYDSISSPLLAYQLYFYSYFSCGSFIFICIFIIRVLLWMSRFLTRYVKWAYIHKTKSFSLTFHCKTYFDLVSLKGCFSRFLFYIPSEV